MEAPERCLQCGAHTFRTYGSRPCCLACLRRTQARIRANLALRDHLPVYAPGILRCAACGAIREEGGEAEWHEGCSHGAHEPKGTPAWRCNGRMRRVTVTELKRLATR